MLYANGDTGEPAVCLRPLAQPPAAHAAAATAAAARVNIAEIYCGLSDSLIAAVRIDRWNYMREDRANYN